MVLTGDEFRENIIRGRYRLLCVACGAIQFSVSRSELIGAVCFSGCVVTFKQQNNDVVLESITYGGE